MGRGFAIEGQVTGTFAGQGGDRLRRDAVVQKPSPIRSQRAAVNQLIGLNQLAEPSVENMPTSAWPTRFFCGTAPPSPPSSIGTRLSALRSDRQSTRLHSSHSFPPPLPS